MISPSPLSWRHQGRVGRWAILALLLVPATAEARPFGPPEQNAFAQAAAYWGRSPTQCRVVTGEVVPAGSLRDPSASGEATVPPASGEMIDCRVWVVEGLTPLGLCFTMRHEYGHLLGYDHDAPEMAEEALACPTGAAEVERFRRMVRRQRQRCEKLRRQGAPPKQKQICWDNLGFAKDELRKVEAELSGD